MTITTRTTITYTEGDVSVNLPVRPDSDVLYDEARNEVRFLTYDEMYSEDYEWPEGVEFVQSNSRYLNYCDDADAWLERVHGDPRLDVYPVGVYEHGAIQYTLAGESIHSGDQWDYCVGACIAVPNMSDGQGYTDTEEAARAILREYTDWCNGAVYVMWSVDCETGEYECYGGFIGTEYAEEAVREGW